VIYHSEIGKDVTALTEYCDPERAADFDEVTSGFDQPTTREPREQDQNQSIKQQRDHQRRGVAESQVLKQKLHGSESHRGVCHPAKFDPLPGRAKKTEG